ncbi:MAG: mechanosensitive ion channel family protein [Candidatus Micrarchaeia archaeon]
MSVLEFIPFDPTAYAIALSIVALAASFAAARVFYFVFSGLTKFFTSRTRTTLDDRILAAIKRPLELILLVACFTYAASVVKGLAFWADLLGSFSLAIFALLAGYLLSEATGAALRWYYEEGSKSSRMVRLDVSLIPLLRKISKVLIYAVAVSFALSFLGINITAILAIGSITGLILGLASQETLANFFAGLALLSDRPFEYGDYLRFPTGEVAVLKRIGLRSSTLEDADHNTIVISNSELAKQRITNLCRPSHKTRITLTLAVAHGQDLERIAALITRTLSGARIPGMIKDEPPSVRVASWSESGVRFSVIFTIDDFRSAAAATDAAYRALYAAFRKNKVKLQ